MITLHVVGVNEQATFQMRRNFLKIVDKDAHDSVVSYLNAKGKTVQLDYDVQSAVLELFTQLRILEAEKKTLRASIDGKTERIKDLESKQPPPPQDESLPKFIAYAERVKKLFLP
jgi:YD repeat-containing protein